MDHHDSHRGFRSSWSGWSIGRKAAVIAGIGVAVVVVFALCGFVFMWLWNWLMPKVFGLPEIGYWEGLGLIALSKILFGGVRGSAKSEDRRRKKRLRERMEAEGEGEGAVEA
jgi:hypothetical protein